MMIDLRFFLLQETIKNNIGFLSRQTSINLSGVSEDTVELKFDLRCLVYLYFQYLDVAMMILASMISNIWSSFILKNRKNTGKYITLRHNSIFFDVLTDCSFSKFEILTSIRVETHVTMKYF